MEITGKIIAILEKKSGVAKLSGKAWMVQEFVIETQEAYPKKVCFEVFGEERIKEFDIKMMDELTVSFDVDAREYNGKWYNTLYTWKVKRQAETGSFDVSTVSSVVPIASISDLTRDNEDVKDWPF